MKHADLELDINAQPVKQIANQDCAGIDIQDLSHPIIGVVVKELIQPFQRIMVRLADAAKIAGDSRRTTKVDIRAIGAFGIQRLDVAGADDLHGCRDGRQIAIQLLLFHFPNLDKPPGHQAPVGDGAFGSFDQPGEVLQQR